MNCSFTMLIKIYKIGTQTHGRNQIEVVLFSVNPNNVKVAFHVGVKAIVFGPNSTKTKQSIFSSAPTSNTQYTEIRYVNEMCTHAQVQSLVFHIWCI